MQIERAPKFRRRRAARPEEILQAAIEVFSERGFAAAKLDEIAARAGLSKGGIYLYFATKAQLFEAVVREAVAPNVTAALALLESHQGPFADIAPALLARIAGTVSTTRAAGVAKLVVGESQNFPELARIWHDALVAPGIAALTGAIARAQARGEVREGDPRLYAFSLLGPMVLSGLWGEVIAPIGGEPIDPAALASQHSRVLLHGMLVTGAGKAA
jgi:AcrR family transcriptional regulator